MISTRTSGAVTAAKSFPSCLICEYRPSLMPFRAARSGLKMGSWLPADAVGPEPVQGRVNTDDLAHHRLPSGAPVRSANRTPRRATRSPSILVLYRSLAASVALNRTRPSRKASAIQGSHLVRDGDVRVKVQVTGPGVAVGERGRDQAGHVNLPHPGAAGAGERRLPFQPPQRVRDRCPVGSLNLFAHVTRGDRPQGGDRLHWGGRQDVPGHRGCGLAGGFGDVPMQAASLRARVCVRWVVVGTLGEQSWRAGKAGRV